MPNGEAAGGIFEAEVLRQVWAAQGQTQADLDEVLGTQRSCKRMADVGFDDMAGGGDLRSAWRKTLEREGKLKADGGSVADLVFGHEPDMPR